MSEEQLPSGWALTEIAKILVPQITGKPFQQGWSPRCHSQPSSEDEWGVLKTTAIQQSEFWPHENKLLPLELEPRPAIEVKAGDVLMTCAGPRNRCGVACYVETAPPKLMMSGKMYRFRPDERAVDPKYLMHFLSWHESQVIIDRMKTGISDSGLNLTHGRFAAFPLKVPPRREQKRIVAKIEELFAKLDKGIESLRDAQTRLKLYRQSVLKQAFEGALTTLPFMSAPAKEVPRLSAKLQIEERLEDLPSGYQYTHLRHLTDPERPITYGVIKLGKDDPNGIPTLRSSDVRSLQIDETSVKKISPQIASNFSRTFLRGGEVLMTIRGTLGGVAVAGERHAGWNISREVAMIAPSNSLDAEYLQYCISSPQMQSWIKSKLRGVAYTGINLATLRSAPIIYCDLQLQKTIVSIIKEKMSGASALLAEIETQLAKSEALRQSILKQAFSGKLVPQDPNDEPASELLERIRAERAAAKPPKRQPRKRKAKAKA